MQLLQRLAVRLGEENVDEDDLEAQPHDVHEQVLPVDVLEADGVDEGAWVVSGCFGGGGLENVSPNITAVRPKSWNHDKPFVRT